MPTIIFYFFRFVQCNFLSSTLSEACSCQTPFLDSLIKFSQQSNLVSTPRPSAIELDECHHASSHIDMPAVLCTGQCLPVCWSISVCVCLSVSPTFSVCLCPSLLLIINFSVNGHGRRSVARLSRANARPPVSPTHRLMTGTARRVGGHNPPT